MGRQLIDITGKKYNMLTVLKFSHMVKNRSFWVCQCDCGNIVTLQRSAIVNTHLPSRNISCGCVKKELDNVFGNIYKQKVKDILKIAQLTHQHEDKGE